jgi:aminopeptidase N
MVMADRMQLDSYLKLVAKYGAEPRLAVWEAILNNLTGLDQLAAGTPERPLVRRFLADLAAPKLARLGWDEKPGEAIEDRQLRARLAGVMARIGDPAAIAEGRARFKRYLADPSSVSPSMIDFVVGVAGRYADQATYDALAARATQTQSNEERNRFGGALARSTAPALAARTLQLALSPQLPPQLTTMIVPMVAANDHIDQAWAFAVANREALVRDRDAIGQNRAFSGIVASSSDAAHADMMESYVGQHFGPDALAEAKRVGNGIRIRAALKARLLPQVRAALK